MAAGWRNTETVRFLLHRYGRATVEEAVEVAAQQAREPILDGCEDMCRIPVSVAEVARRLGVTEGKYLEDADGYRGVLLAGSNAQVARIERGGTVGRDRFTLAHEIGHSLFREGARHRVSLVSRRERQAEDHICTLFAAALLMPAATMPSVVRTIPSDNPWSIMTALEAAARHFAVSIPALTLRLGQVRCSPSPSLVLICLAYFPNRYTQSQPALRVHVSSQLGKCWTIRTWYNQSAKGLGLKSADALFDLWSEVNREDAELRGGRYTLDKMNRLIGATKHSLRWVPEVLNLSVYDRGRWHRQAFETQVSNCLYARKGWGRSQAYVLVVAKMR